jgi:ribosomal protein S18 acetylase RimI-like enzyme
MGVRWAAAGEARRQGGWIAALEPWRSLGYQAPRLGTWLARMAGQNAVRVATMGRGAKTEVCGIVVVQPNVLLGDFIALLAVRPEHAGRGVGRALVEDVAARTFRRRRWLFTSSDAGNRVAARFYRRLGFVRVGRLPGLVQAGRTEVLWRRGRDTPPSGRAPGRVALKGDGTQAG